MGIIAYDGRGEPLEDPSVGQIRFYIKSWGENSFSDDLMSEIETRPCDSQDFNDMEGSNKETNFFATSRLSDLDLKSYGTRLRCIVDRSKLQLWGNYDTTETANLVAAFDRCNNSTSPVTCKSEEEIT